MEYGCSKSNSITATLNKNGVLRKERDSPHAWIARLP
jgi:hypothetical protein